MKAQKTVFYDSFSDIIFTIIRAPDTAWSMKK